MLISLLRYRRPSTDAKTYAKKRAEICAAEEAVKRGLSSTPDIHLSEKELYFPSLNTIRDILIEASV